MAPIAPKLDQVMFSFIYFCPPPGTNPMPYWSVPPYGNCDDSSAFQLLSVDPKDAPYLATIAGFKTGNPGLKLLLSVGGWNYPSEYFSKMASEASSRATFIASVQAWMQKYDADGVDIDWESPCSGPRADPVEISCTDFQTVTDRGGACPQDTDNIVLLFAEMRAALGPAAVITIATQASKQLELKMNVTDLVPYVSYMHLMSYDYTVSDVPDAGNMAPNCPLYNPANASVLQMSIDYTVKNYLAAGVPPAKIMIGVPLYAHSWYNPSLTQGSAWAAFGNPSVVQGQCCGPFVATNGAQPGKGSSLCGTMMYSEVQVRHAAWARVGW